MKNNLSKWTIIQIFITGTGIVFSFLIFLLNSSPTWAGRVDKKLSPFLNSISFTQWLLILIGMWVVIVLLLIWAERQKIKSEVIDFQPHIKFIRCDVDRVDKNREFYEKDSYLTKYLHSKRELVYFDVANIPPKKDKEKGTARDVSYWVEVHNYDQERLKHKEYRAKWVPETEEKIDIIPDGYTNRVGLCYTDGHGNLILLKSDYHYDKNGMGSQLDSLYYGKFVFVVYISTGNDIYDDSPLFFLVENPRNEPPKISEMKNGDVWVKGVKKANSDLWKNLIKDNEKKS